MWVSHQRQRSQQEWEEWRPRRGENGVHSGDVGVLGHRFGTVACDRGRGVVHDGGDVGNFSTGFRREARDKMKKKKKKFNWDACFLMLSPSRLIDLFLCERKTYWCYKRDRSDGTYIVQERRRRYMLVDCGDWSPSVGGSQIHLLTDQLTDRPNDQQMV